MLIEFRAPLEKAAEVEEFLIQNYGEFIDDFQIFDSNIIEITQPTKADIIIPVKSYEILLKADIKNPEEICNNLANDLHNRNLIPEGKMWMVLFNSARKRLPSLNDHNLDEADVGQSFGVFLKANGNIKLILRGEFLEEDNDKKPDFEPDFEFEAHRLWCYCLKYLPSETLEELKQIFEKRG